MYKVYVIQSQVDKRLYVGMSENISRRVKEHNAGFAPSTKGYRPWKLVYFEEVGDRMEARKREKYFKSGFGKEHLKSILNNVPG